MNLEDVENIENGAGDDAYFEAIQRAINSGEGWKFQGSFGRAMMNAIETGYALLGRERARDYYGSLIPSREDVREGTKGSFAYVAARNGEEYAKRMAEL